MLGLGGYKHTLELKDVAHYTSDNHRQTALRWVAELRGLQIINIFLEQEDETLNTLDNYCQTLLLWATELGKMKVSRFSGEKMMALSTRGITVVEHLSCRSVRDRTRRLSQCFWRGRMSLPIPRIMVVEHHSHGLLSVGIQIL